ncbi:MAG: type II toxin-antitoxin system VapC family toxin [Microcystis sp.]
MLIKLFTIDNVPLANRKRYSQASIWEMAIKYSLGKLTFDSPFREFIESQIQSNDFQILPLNLLHFERVAQLPFQHCIRYVWGKFGYITI